MTLPSFSPPTPEEIEGSIGVARISVSRTELEQVDRRRAEREAARVPEPARREAVPEPELDEAGEPIPDSGWRPGCTDLANGHRMAQRFGAELRYCPLWGCWLCWDGKRWRRDDTKRVWRLARATVRGIYAEAAKAETAAERETLAKWAIKSEARAALANMIDLASSEPGIPVTPDELDANPWLLNVRNGTINLRTGELRNHNRGDLITKLAPVEYDPSGARDTWDAFLDRAMAGDAKLIDYLKRMVGLSLVGQVLEHVLFFLYGLGANGKSTFLDALLATLGDYAKQAPPELLMHSQHDRHPTERADLFGVRLVASVEVEAGKRMAEVLVKQLTGGDRIKARYMRQDFFEFAPAHTILLAANHKPVIYGNDHAIWRRIRLVPFTVQIPAEEQDRQLGAKLAAERAGILAWAVCGCLDWQRGGLSDPPAVVAATESYRAEMDTIGAFLGSRCVVRPSAQVTATAIYEAYVNWTVTEGERAASKKSLGLRLQERGFRAGKDTQDRRCWLGIGLISSSVDAFDVSSGSPHEKNASPGEPGVTSNASKTSSNGTCPHMLTSTVSGVSTCLACGHSWVLSPEVDE